MLANEAQLCRKYLLAFNNPIPEDLIRALRYQIKNNIYLIKRNTNSIHSYYKMRVLNKEYRFIYNECTKEIEKFLQ